MQLLIHFHDILKNKKPNIQMYDFLLPTESIVCCPAQDMGHKGGGGGGWQFGHFVLEESKI